MAIQPDGKIVAVGVGRVIGQSSGNTNDFVVARYNPEGSLDSSFGNWRRARGRHGHSG